MRIYLAPMEGVINPNMRELMSRVAHFDLMVTEFVRVVDRLLPRPVYRRFSPELANGGKTANGTPVRVQLLGQDPRCIADNAARAIELNSPGIDLNFGCPAKTVNKSKGGAVLLKDPELIYAIVAEVRKTIGNKAILSAKMRLGFHDNSLMLDNAQAIESAGASELIVHARTRDDGYKPPAYWQQIKIIKQQVALPVVANGEIWNAEHAKQCQYESGCRDLMLGRGALALPNLSEVIRGKEEAMSWPTLLQFLLEHAELEAQVVGKKQNYYANRLKQWLKYLCLHYGDEAKHLFTLVRPLKEPEEIKQQISALLAKAEAK